MDNIAHTLAGAALGEAGLKRKTGLAMATLMIAANLPDIDAFGLLFGHNLDWRRGWTHGPVALVILPVLLALAMYGFDRWQARRGKRPEGRLPVRFGWLVALSYLGMLTHPALDFLNTYGVRLLMPFSDRWFYGDTLFIIDPFMWGALGIGIWLARRRRAPAAAGAAIAAVLLYIGAMAAGGRSAERIAAREIEARGFGRPDMVLASPVPANPLRRDLVFVRGDSYGSGEFRWTPAPRVTLAPAMVPTNMSDPAVLKAAEDREVAAFLYWSRLPLAVVERDGRGALVTISDARYSNVPNRAGFTRRVRVPE
ncbi:MAG: metal-dependent hydrolase [Allosphingosinicella sp.]|uniref:metal-dependent hydrolase n=1 Tax=Allosphingosinicella sp. TaxID=2823234 RepID=UPI0039214167